MMAGYQRQVSGPAREVRVIIKALAKVSVGDFVFRGAAGNAPYAQTFTQRAPGADPATHDAFIGVLRSGATDGIQTGDRSASAAGEGEFRYPLNTAAVAALPVGTPVKPVGDQVVATMAQTAFAAATGFTSVPIAVGDTMCTFKLRSSAMEGRIPA
jgi:hypothetical protein